MIFIGEISFFEIQVLYLKNSDGLYLLISLRSIQNYDFVGNMDSNFMSDLNRIATQFGGPFPNLLDSIFNYKNYTSNTTYINVGSDRGHGTKAPEKVVQFYSPQSLRRALEYVSIDYVMLGLQIPQWARQMLKNDAI